MYLYTRPITGSDLSRFRNAVKSSHDRLRNDYDAKKAAVRSPERDTALAKWLTIDNVGGRSDALGRKAYGVGLEDVQNPTLRESVSDVRVL